MLLSVFLLVASPAARAGDGPWTLEPGEHNVYAGYTYFRYGRVTGGTGEVGDLPTTLVAGSFTAVWTAGVIEGVELELVVPWESVRAADPMAEACVDPPQPGFCRKTGGLGDVRAVAKVRLVNEFYGSPVSLAVQAGLRSGEAYSEERGRLTTLGEGQTDVGGGLVVGRTDVVGGGWYRAGAQAWYWYRFPNTRSDEGLRVPGDDVAWAAEATWSPRGRFGVGPAAYGFHRLWGAPFEEADLADLDVWGSLKAQQVQAGLKGGVFGVLGRGELTLSAAVLRTVWSRNNPADTTALTLGLGWFVRPSSGAGG